MVSQLFDAIVEVNRQGTAVLLVEQFVHLALRHTSRAYVLGRGEILVEGSSRDLLSSPDIMAAYLGETVAEVAQGEGQENGQALSTGEMPAERAEPGG
jgi:ABC-type lipopolysaccharide export system ATPase subunit